MLVHLVDEVHQAGLLEATDLIVREAHADLVPGKLRDVLRQRGELHQHVGLIGIDDQQPAAVPGGAKAGDEAVEVLARGHHRNELVGLGAGQLDQLPLDVVLRAQAVRAAR